MDILAAVAKNQSKAQCRRIVKYIGGDERKFKELVDVYVAGPYRITQHAAWPLSVCLEDHPDLVTPHLGKILKFARNKNAHPAVKRNTMRLLQYVEIPKRFQGQIIDLAFEFLTNRKEPIAVRVFSITVLDRLLVGQPDLLRELKIILEDGLPYATPAYRVRAMKVLRQLDSQLMG